MQHVGTKLCRANGAFWHEKPYRLKEAKPARWFADFPSIEL
jgi:hypothetical protein